MPTAPNLPSLAGLCSLDHASTPGLPVEQVVRRLKRFHYAFKRLHQIFTARLTAEPLYELKMAFSHHAYLCAEHVAALRKRVAEMREPPLGLDITPDTNLEIFFDEILATPTTEELVQGIYAKSLPALIRGLNRHIQDTNPLADAPTIRILRFALLELADMQSVGQKAIQSLNPQPNPTWLQLLDQCLTAANDLDGANSSAIRNPQSEIRIPKRHYSAKPFAYDKTPRRDNRFTDPYNAGVNPEAFLYDEKYPPKPKTLMMYYKRLREIDVPEMMASIITETPSKPWDYYLDMTRQLWDEARHAMMGQVGFVANRIDWTQIPINFTWSLNLNTQLTPIERHAVLFFIEQGLMPKTGKRFEWEIATQSGDPLAALFQDFDWADEVLHAKIGRDWYVKDFPDAKKAIAYGDQCWSRIMIQWEQYKQKGLTQHRNWWPEIYQQACQNWGITPDPDVLAFSQTYQSLRADLKAISASG